MIKCDFDCSDVLIKKYFQRTVSKKDNIVYFGLKDPAVR